MYGVTTNYDKTLFGREVIDVWSGSFMSDWEAEGVALPKGDGYMLKTYAGDKLRVTCEAPRTNDNFMRVDEAISNAMKRYYEERAVGSI